jgi:surface polysaccharide O-acyltransferase-like enzyme
LRGKLDWDYAASMTKKAWIDYLRILAVLAVITAHTTSDFFCKFGEIRQLEWWLANIINALCRYPIGLFIMVSGAVLLGRQYTPQEFYRRRATRLIPPLVFWNLAYLLFYIYQGMDTQTLTWLLKAQIFADGYVAIHLWYLSMFICLMLFVPFINKFINGEKPTQADLFVFLGLASLFYILNGVSIVGTELFNITIDWFKTFVWYIPYLIAGYYIDKYADHIRVRKAFIILLISVLFSIGILVHYYLARTYGIVEDYIVFCDAAPLGLLVTSSIFLLARKSSAFLVENKVVTTVSGATFGIYLIHEIIASILIRGLPGFYSDPMRYVPIVIALTAAFSLAAILLMRKVPFLKAVC